MGTGRAVRTIAHQAARRALGATLLAELAVGLTASFVAAVITTISARLLGSEQPGWWILPASVVIGAGIAAVRTFPKRWSIDRAARALDDALGLHDRLGSALGLEGRDDPFAQWAIADGEAMASRVNAGSLPVARLTALWWIWPIAALCLGAALVWMPVWERETQATQQAEIDATLSALAQARPPEPVDELQLPPEPEVLAAQQAIDELEAELREGKRDPLQARAEAARELEQSAQALEERADQTRDELDSLRQAAARQANELRSDTPQPAQEQPAAEATDQIPPGTDAVDAAPRSGDDQPQTAEEALQPLLDALQRGDLDEAANAAEELDNRTRDLPPEEVQRLQEQLEALQRSIEESQPPLPPETTPPSPTPPAQRPPAEVPPQDTQPQQTPPADPSNPTEQPGEEPPQPDPNAQPQPDPNAQPQPDPNAQPQPDPNAQPQPDPNAQPQPDPNAQPQPDPNAQPQPDPNAQPQPDPNAQPQPDPNAQPQPDPNAQPQPDPNAQPQPDPNAQPQPDPNAQPQPDPNAQPQPDPNAQPQPDPNAQPQPDPNAQPSPDAPGDQDQPGTPQSAREVRDQIEQLRDRQRAAERQREQAQRMRENAQRLLDPADQQTENPGGEQPDQPNQADQQQPQPPTGQAGEQEEFPTGTPQTDASADRPVDIVDATRPDQATGGETVGEAFGDRATDPTLRSGRTITSSGIREAQQTAERAIEQQAVPPDRRSLIRRVYQRLADRQSQPAPAPAQPPSQSGDNP